MPTTHPADTRPRGSPDGTHRRTQAVLAAAEDETNAIVAGTAAQIHELVVRAQRDLALLARQVDVTVAATDGAGAQRPGVSTPARDALVTARQELDRLIEDVRAAEADRNFRTPATRLGHRSMVLLTAVLLACGGVWVMAARWMREVRDPTAITLAPAATVGTSGVPVDTSPSRDDLRLSGERWLHAYFDHGAGPAPVEGEGPTIQDERPPSERVTAVARRVIAPAQVEVVGDAAVLSTSVTEYASGSGVETVSLVSQLWTRPAGQWRLDQVRIVDARSAERAFRR